MINQIEFVFLENVFVSTEILTTHFTCDLLKCKGACCLKGDVGAPLSKQEVKNLQINLDSIMPYPEVKNLLYIESFGFRSKDDEDKDVTACLNGNECVFSFQENGIYNCAIQKAYEEDKIDFPKPVSCDLYPIRINTFHAKPALRLDRWDICEPAYEKGKENETPVYKFCKEGLIRKFGKNWYKRLEKIAETY
ncbi:MAG: DUF3109 family protein [Candidatus Cloacimonetes bacterium]|nr:DUF3109 family protein [Candidatus Cloacimonadota bacterium]MBS3767371.1 DUF3109 family protein [Candidatus Cloacimonadota bacterium]